MCVVILRRLKYAYRKKKQYKISDEKYGDTKELAGYKMTKAGERAIIVAPGPSTKLEDLHKISDSGVDVYILNAVLFTFCENRLRFNGFVCGDKKIFCSLPVENNYGNIISQAFLNQELKDVNEKKYCIQAVYFKKRYSNWWNCHELDQYHVERFMSKRSDISLEGCNAVDSIAVSALELLIYMGYSEIAVYGLDCDHTKGIHFDNSRNIEKANTRSAEEWQKFDTCVIEEVKMIAGWAKENGQILYNVSNGGKLDCISRMSVEDFISGIR